VRTATGGDAWDQFGECDSERTITVAGKTGTLHYAEDLHTGANVVRLNIPDLWVKADLWTKPVSGVAPNGNWRPDFGGAAVEVPAPAVETGAIYDRLQIQVPGGHGFTHWIKGATGEPRIAHRHEITKWRRYKSNLRSRALAYQRCGHNRDS
jgi:hypothetical protein